MSIRKLTKLLVGIITISGMVPSNTGSRMGPMLCHLCGRTGHIA